QFIEPGEPDEAAAGNDAGIADAGRKRPLTPALVLAHGAEFVEPERMAAQPAPVLDENDRPAVPDEDVKGDAGGQHHGDGHGDDDDDQIELALEPGIKYLAGTVFEPGQVELGDI